MYVVTGVTNNSYFIINSTRSLPSIQAKGLQPESIVFSLQSFLYDTLSLSYFLLSMAAFTNPLNNGWALFGRDFNSGWNCTPTNQG